MSACPEWRALVELGHYLQTIGYRFITVTPRTHSTILARPPPTRPLDARDIFGWNQRFDPNDVSPELVGWMFAAGILSLDAKGMAKSTVRFATLGERIFVHSAFPTNERDAVFFGPDTYRFCAAIGRLAPKARCAVDVGCGGGVGGIVLTGKAERVVLADVSRRALDFARTNVELAGARGVEIVEADVLGGVQGEIDLVVANPPYMSDDADRTYRDGGGDYGEGLAVRIVHESLARLRSGGTLLLYTGAPVVEGKNVVLEKLNPVLSQTKGDILVEELDPDVFGEELEEPRYRDVERIAAMVLKVTIQR